MKGYKMFNTKLKEENKQVKAENADLLKAIRRLNQEILDEQAINRAFKDRDDE